MGYSRNCKGKSLLSFTDDYVLLDIETTGLSPKENDIIEIGAIRVRNNKIVDEYSSLIKIGYELPSFITKITGITDEMLEDGKDISIVLRELVDFIGDDIMIGHNVNFDINFIYDKCEKYINHKFNNDFIDTMRIARRVLPDIQNYKLGTLANYFNIDYHNAHRGLNDVMITYEVYNNLRKIKVV